MEQPQEEQKEEEEQEQELRKEAEMEEQGHNQLQKEEETEGGQQLTEEGKLELQKENEKEKELGKEEEDDLQLREEYLDKEDDLAKEEEEEEKDVTLLKEKEKQQILAEDLQLHKEEQANFNDNLQLPEEEEQLPKQKEDKDNLPLPIKELNLQLSKEVQLPKEKEEDDNLQLPKEDDLQLGKEDNDLQSPKEEEKEEKEQQLQEENDLQLSKEEDNLQVEEEEKAGDLELLKEEEDRGGIEQDAEEKDFDNSAESDRMTIDDQCEKTQELDDDDPQLAEPPSPVDADADADAETGVVGSEETGGGLDVNMEDVEVATEDGVADVSKAKKKRGRTLGKTKPTPPRKKKDEEDVCFICYDGGSLVLCDRRGCPKAYHPACIKRDESFFQSTAKWNCDWHICSSCQKASHFMCYTCAYSLCKGCTKDADYVCLRGNKGFCGACMRTIMLIENISPGNTETVQVDFDDKTSWEYLFKDYWIDLKAKLSITIDELSKAKNPWKGDELPKAKNSGKGTGGIVATKEASPGELNHDDEKDLSLDNGGNVEANRSKRRKTKDQAKVLNKQNSLVMEDSDVDEVTPLATGTAWATKELLEFLAHMKNGDTSVTSQFDVQALLIEYVKRNNLRDPRKKSQIICDSRLRNLFGQPRVGHFEMLKLVENHFLIKENSPADERMGVSDAGGSEAEAAGSSDSRNDRRRKKSKKMDGRRSRINSNSEEYAAIDVHNINLLFLKRNLIENLMDDIGKFHEMVVGSFVRIRISGGDQKQNMYRLVPVVGTSKVDESYKVGSRTTDFMLEILNLDKKEVVSIDGISNQEFLEDECRRLRQSIKCGLVKRLTVGEIQEKAMALQPFKVNDWLQAEMARLNHLRDRASETGRDYVRPRSTGFGRKILDRNSSMRDGDLNDVGNRAQKNLATASEQSRNITTPYVDRESRWSQGGGAFGLNNQSTSKSQLSPTGLVTSDWSSRAAIRSESHAGVASVVVPSSLSSGREASHTDFETQKMWLYQDPSGKIQGPFSIVQLRKWSSKGHFPPHFRVWRTGEKQDDSILLTDALDGRVPKKP
ncbi:set domain protein, putative [Ricinus communis]|uniref:Set domain protein, putative n=1 Tax=Ricinus communis TaxID=3988 RepID=B9T004_RICCO|nr:set domain protein, putative [Ricinus communis]